jgi:hypothetical protein
MSWSKKVLSLSKGAFYESAIAKAIGLQFYESMKTLEGCDGYTY